MIKIKQNKRVFRNACLIKRFPNAPQNKENCSFQARKIRATWIFEQQTGEYGREITLALLKWGLRAQ